MLQLAWWFNFSACFTCVHLLVACKPRATREIQLWVPASLHSFEHFFTLSHTLPLHDSHLNIGLLLLNYKQIWHGIKPTRWLIKFNLTDSLNGCTSSKFKMTIRFLKWMHIVQVQEDDKINIDQEYFNKKFSKSPDGRRELFNKNSLSSNMDKENTSIRILQVPRWTKRTLQWKFPKS